MDQRLWLVFRRFDVEDVSCQVEAVVAPVEAERSAEEAGAVRLSWKLGDGLKGAQEDRMRHTMLSCHEVQTMPHPVDEVDVGVSRRSKHDLVAGTAMAAGGVSGKIFGALVSFGLDDAPDHLAAFMNIDEMMTDQLARDDEGVPSVEGAFELARHDERKRRRRLGPEVGAGGARSEALSAHLEKGWDARAYLLPAPLRGAAAGRGLLRAPAEGLLRGSSGGRLAAREELLGL